MVLRQEFYIANSMYERFIRVKRENIWSFLREAGLYDLISFPDQSVIILSRNNKRFY